MSAGGGVDFSVFLQEIRYHSLLSYLSFEFPWAMIRWHVAGTAEKFLIFDCHERFEKNETR